MTDHDHHGDFHWFDRLRAAAIFYTRLPLGAPTEGPDLAAASAAVPIVGAGIGLVGGAVFWLALNLAAPTLVAGLLALAATMAVTGALHEDGLADTADGIGAILAGGRSREDGLAIMRDSRIGSFGVLALIVTIGLRMAALADLSASTGLAALIAVHAAARGFLPLVMQRLNPARADGLAVRAGRPRADQSLAAAAIGVVIALVALGPTAGAVALVAGGLAAWALASLARQRLGGYTGDVLGAIEQTGETAMLVAVATML